MTCDHQEQRPSIYSRVSVSAGKPVYSGFQKNHLMLRANLYQKENYVHQLQYSLGFPEVGDSQNFATQSCVLQVQLYYASHSVFLLFVLVEHSLTLHARRVLRARVFLQSYPPKVREYFLLQYPYNIRRMATTLAFHHRPEAPDLKYKTTYPIRGKRKHLLHPEVCLLVSKELHRARFVLSFHQASQSSQSQ